MSAGRGGALPRTGSYAAEVVEHVTEGRGGLRRLVGAVDGELLIDVAGGDVGRRG
jgi:hypothetical protein